MMEKEKRFYPKHKLRDCCNCISQDKMRNEYPCVLCTAQNDEEGIEFFTHWYPKPSEHSRIINNSDIQKIKQLCNVLIAYITKGCTPDSIREQIEKIEEIKFIVEKKTNDHYNI